MSMTSAATSRGGLLALTAITLGGGALLGAMARDRLPDREARRYATHRAAEAGRHAGYRAAETGRTARRHAPEIVRYSAAGGTAAGLLSGAILMLLSKRRGGTAWQPFNATSHWIHGDDAGEVRDANITHTLPGAATHQAASMFWGTLFALWAGARPRRSAAELAAGAAGAAAFAGAFDYGAIPRRLSPGWELVLSPREVAAGFAAMGVGLLVGGLLARPRA